MQDGSVAIKPPVDPEYDKRQAELEQAKDNILNNAPGIIAETSYDPYVAAKPYAYNPNSTQDLNKNFEHFYSHPAYKQLGFNPWQDNETLYNDKGSALGDVWRATKAAAKLAGTGFVSPLRSYADIFTGSALDVDFKSADEMKYHNMVGSSSRGGVTGFASNLITNSGYTLGIMGEMAMEMGALTALEAVSFGASTPLAVARLGMYGKDLGKVSTAIKGITETVNSLKDFGAAKAAWEATKATGKFINPLERTTELFSAGEKFKELGNMAKASKTAGAFYRDLSMANLTLSESKMEGATAERDLQEELIGEYRKKHNGLAPDVDTLTEIRQTAHDAGMSTLNWNIPTIFLTNKLTFAPLFKSLDKFAGTAYKEGVKFIEKKGEGIVEATLKNTFTASLKPRAVFGNTLAYFKGNLSEGIQETAQDIVSGTAKQYYKNLYYNPAKQGLDYSLGEYKNDGVWDMLSKNVTDQFSGKGFETFASGFLMGGLLGAAGRVIKAPYQAFKEYKQERSAYKESVKQSLNEIYKDPLKFFGPGILNYSNGTAAVQGQEKSDGPKEWLDLENQNLSSQVMTALETGTYDIFLQKLRSISTMDPQAIKEAYGLEGNEVLPKIGKIITRAESLKENYDKWSDKAGANPFEPKKYKKDSEEYKNEAVGYVSWEAAKKLAVFNESTFNRNLQRVQGISDGLLSAGLGKVSGLDISLLYDPGSIKNEIRLLSNEIEVLDSTGNRKEASGKRIKQKNLENFLSKLSGFHMTKAIEQIENKDEALKAAGEDYKKTNSKQLFKAYQDYITDLVDRSGGQPVHLDAIESSFNQLMDLHDLKQDNLYYAQAISLMANPKGFIEQAKRMKTNLSDLYNSRGEIINKSIEFAQSKIEDNTVLTALFQRGFVLSPENANKLINDKEVPKEFYDTNAKEVVSESDSRYAEFQQIIKPYLEVTKPEAAEPEVVEEVPEVKTVEDELPEELIIDLDKMFDGIKEGKDLDTIEAELMILIRKYPIAQREKAGILSNIFTARINAKKAELAKSISFENLVAGNVVVIRYEGGDAKAWITRKGKDSISVRLLSENTKITIMKDNINNTVRYKFSEYQEETKKATPDEAKKVVTNNANQEKLLDNRELVAQIVEEALNDKEKANKEFFETLGCK